MANVVKRKTVVTMDIIVEWLQNPYFHGRGAYECVIWAAEDRKRLEELAELLSLEAWESLGVDPYVDSCFVASFIAFVWESVCAPT